MSIKLMLIKSGEDLIADVQEIVFGEDDERRVVGYHLTRPCVVKMRNQNLPTEETGPQKAGYQVFLYPWIPLTSDEKIPVPSDWVVTLVNPTDKLKEMYITDVINYENNKASNSSHQSGIDNPN